MEMAKNINEIKNVRNRKNNNNSKQQTLIDVFV